MVNTTKAKSKTKGENRSKFSKQDYLSWYKSMRFIRKFEEKVGQLYGQQKIKGFCHLYIGQEACIVGAVSALEKGDKYITAYRDHAHPISLGSDPKAIMAELYGKETGICKGKGGSMHMFDKKNNFFGGHGIVGGQVPLGAGIAFSEKYNKTGKLCICYMGDGAVRQGAFHETLNCAMLWKLPILFVIENNGYAMGTSVQRTSNVTDLSTLGESYDIPSVAVDAMLVEEVHCAVQDGARRARKGDGPTLLEFRTYRYKGHSMSDPAKYRAKEELVEYKERDPIGQVKAVLLRKNYASEKDFEQIDTRIKEQVAECVDFAENSSFPNPSQVFKDVYVEENYPYIMN